MEFLREMITILDEARLDEDFGNLKQVNRKLLRALSNSTWSSSKYKDKIIPKIGQNSEVKEIDIKNSKDYTSLLDDPQTSGVLGVVIFDKLSGTQFGMVGIQTEKTYSKEAKMGITVDYLAISGKGATPDMIRDNRSWVIDEIKAFNNDKDGVVISVQDYKASRAAKLYTVVKKVTSTWEKVQLAAKLIYADKERPATSSKRKLSRSGVIPVKLEGKAKEDFLNSAKYSLKTRLDAYKKEKLKNQNKSIDIKDFIGVIKKEGYLDKFLVDGFIYEYYRDNWNFDNLRKGKHKSSNYESDRSFITYRIDEQAQDYQVLRRKYWEGRSQNSEDLKDDSEAWKAADAKLKKRLKLPPTYIKVFFDFEGGMIVPTELALEADV